MCSTIRSRRRLHLRLNMPTPISIKFLNHTYLVPLLPRQWGAPMVIFRPEVCIQCKQRNNSTCRLAAISSRRLILVEDMPQHLVFPLLLE